MSAKISLVTNNAVKKTIAIKNDAAADQGMVNFAKAYVKLLENNDGVKSVNKIITTALSVE